MMPFSMSPFAPVTPKRLFNFEYGSPYRTPQSSKRMFDQNDPLALLDDEMARMNKLNGPEMSPSGLYGRSGRGLLYESPSIPDPDRLDRLW